jgi:hypothetical protein
MIKTTQILLAFALPLTTMAQITLTTANMPVAGTVLGQITDTTIHHAIPSSGANQTWNYASGYFIIAKTDTSVVKLQALNTIPAAYQVGWSASDFAYYDKADSFAELFFTNASGFHADGIYVGSKSYNPNNKIAYTPGGDLLIPTPFTYNNTVKNTYRTVLLGVGFEQTSTITNNYTADAWGNLTTPFGNQGSCLRIKNYQLTIDSLFLGGVFNSPASRDSSTTYDWYNSTIKGPVMEVDVSSANAVTASWSDPNLKLSSVNNIVLPLANINVYPNPCSSGSINFSFDNVSAVETLIIFDGAGQLLRKENIANANVVSLQTAGMASGIYFYTALDIHGAYVKRGSFNVVR